MNTMKFHSLVSAGVIAALYCAVTAAQPQPPAGFQPVPAADSALSKEDGSYLMGLQFTEQLQQLGITSDVSSDAIARGVRDGLAGKKMAPQERAADGKPPVPTDQVTVQYRGKLLDGTEFDSSYARNQPATFRVNGVIKGWQEALLLFKPGAKYELWVPPELGYDRTPHPGIPGGSLLAFEVELVAIKPADVAAP